MSLSSFFLKIDADSRVIADEITKADQAAKNLVLIGVWLPNLPGRHLFHEGRGRPSERLSG